MEYSKETKTTFYMRADDEDARVLLRICDMAQQQINLLPMADPASETGEAQQLIQELRGVLTQNRYVSPPERNIF